MRALTVKQPWADLIVSGVKDVENRTWEPPSTLPQWYQCSGCDDRTRPRHHLPPTGHLHKHPMVGGEWHAMHADGPFPFTIAIHAGQSVDYPAMQEHLEMMVATDVASRLDRGAIVGTVDVTGCHSFASCLIGHPDSTFGLCSEWARDPVGDELDKPSFHWMLANARRLDTPIAAVGRQRLWILDDAQHAAVAAALTVAA